MSKYKQAESEEKEAKSNVSQISPKEINDLREALKPYKQKRIQGVLVSRFDQYLLDIGTTVMRDGDIRVKDPAGYTRMSKINAKMEILDDYRTEDIFKTFPEERKKFFERIKSMREKMTL